MHKLDLHLYIPPNLIYSYHSKFISYSAFCNRGSVDAEIFATTTYTITQIFMSCSTESYNQEQLTFYKQTL